MTLDLIDLYLTEQRQLGRSPRTIELRSQVLLRAHHELPYGLDKADTAEIRAWLGHDGWAPQTRAAYHGSFASFFDWAVPDYLDWSPMADIPRPKVPAGIPRPCSDQQLAAILALATDPFRLWALLGAYAGLRCIEISRMRREDITQRAVEVRKGKGGKGRVVPTNELVWEAVRDLPPGAIALTRHSRPASERYISGQAYKHFHRLDVPVSMHQLRHWFGTQIQRQFKDIRVTQVLMGHASPATTAIYTQVADEDAWAAVTALPRVAAP